MPSVLSRRPGTAYFHFNHSHGGNSIFRLARFTCGLTVSHVSSTAEAAACPFHAVPAGPGSHLLTAPARPPQGGSNAAPAAAGSSAPGRRGTLSLLRAAARTRTPQPFSTAALRTHDPGAPPSRLRAPPFPHFLPGRQRTKRRRSPRFSPHDAAPR